MIEVYPHLFVGNQEDYENNFQFQQSWLIVQACKEPYHRLALGYKGLAASKDHPEYLIAKRDNRLILNLVDVADVAYISKNIIYTALDFIQESLETGNKLLIHCNQGYSRAPSIAFLYFAKIGEYKSLSAEEAELEFKNKYPEYMPAKGMQDFIKINWFLYNN